MGATGTGWWRGDDFEITIGASNRLTETHIKTGQVFHGYQTAVFLHRIATTDDVARSLRSGLARPDKGANLSPGAAA